jgi:prepilin signal peptidase PulO-like enzyme (type II secretory pathway)
MSCGKRLGALELVPVFSYIALLGRCRFCGARISPRYILIELTAGALFAYIFSLMLSPLLTVTHLIFLSLLLVVFVYDVEHLIIPDEYALALVPFAFILGVAQLETLSLTTIGGLFVGALCSFLFLGGLWKLSGGRWIGLGDAKLSVPLALGVGLMHTFSLVVFAFWIGAALSVMILGLTKLLARGQKHLRFFRTPLTMKAEVPFAPFLIGSFLIVYYGHADVFTITDAALAYVLSFFS